MRYTLTYRHTLHDNHEDSAEIAEVTLEADPNWAAIAVYDGIVPVTEVTVELFDGELIARVWKKEDFGNDPTVRVVLCKIP